MKSGEELLLWITGVPSCGVGWSSAESIMGLLALFERYIKVPQGTALPVVNDMSSTPKVHISLVPLSVIHLEGVHGISLVRSVPAAGLA